jgi:hypothetical protein
MEFVTKQCNMFGVVDETVEQPDAEFKIGVVLLPFGHL